MEGGEQAGGKGKRGKIWLLYLMHSSSAGLNNAQKAQQEAA